MNIFFDVDYTILALDDSIRPGTKETFQRLVDDGHKVYVWSGVGLRWEVVRKHDLEGLVSGVYEKPTDHYTERLPEMGLPVEPDFVIDDHPEVVAAFGGAWVPHYFFGNSHDQPMAHVYEIIDEYLQKGHSDDRQYRARGTTLPLF